MNRLRAWVRARSLNGALDRVEALENGCQVMFRVFAELHEAVLENNQIKIEAQEALGEMDQRLESVGKLLPGRTVTDDEIRARRNGEL